MFSTSCRPPASNHNNRPEAMRDLTLLFSVTALGVTALGVATGTGSLPFNIAVEIETAVKVRPEE